MFRPPPPPFYSTGDTTERKADKQRKGRGSYEEGEISKQRRERTRRGGARQRGKESVGETKWERQ